MTELKPCPFCGESVLIVHEPLEYEAHYYVYCGECDTSGPSDLGRSGAIEAWNTRPLEAQLLAACKAALFLLVEGDDMFEGNEEATAYGMRVKAELQAAIAAAEDDAP